MARNPRKIIFTNDSHCENMALDANEYGKIKIPSASYADGYYVVVTDNIFK